MKLKDYPYPHFQKDHLLEYILSKIESGASLHFICNIKPAVTFLDKSLGRQSSFSPEMDLVLAGAKRIGLAVRGPVKKAPIVSPSQLRTLIDKFVTPFIDCPHYIDLLHLRVVFRVLIEYHTLCRLDCFRRLKAKHFELAGPDIMITFPSAKNDQHHEGRSSIILAGDTNYCPVKITKLFFSRVGLRFGAEAQDDSFVNCRFRRTPTGLQPAKNLCLSASGSTEALRHSFTLAGIFIPKISDKSVKMAGVTAAYDTGATPEQIRVQGRWKSAATPLHYKTSSLSFKRTVAAVIPSVDSVNPP